MRLDELVKLGVHRGLGALGYRLRALPGVEDMRAATNDPRSLRYAEVGAAVLVDAPLAKGAGLLCFPLHEASPHPFVRAARSGSSADDVEGRVRDVPTRFYDRARPGGVRDRVDVDAGCAGSLRSAPPWGLVLPWEHWDVDELLTVKGVPEEAAAWRPGAPLPLGVPWAGGGPVQPGKLEEEVDRTAALLRSVQRRGYLRSSEPHGDIHAVVLHREDGEWRWLVRWGQHRAAVLAALGRESAPVRVDAEVERAEVDLWPNVQRGVYSRAAALRTFDRVFDRELPPLYDDWLGELNSEGGAA
jgi:hypothetical protein